MNNSKFWSLVERYHAAGFALHWLKEKSKAPVAKGWGDGDRPRLSLDELRRTYRKGFNLGVRLGKPGRLKKGGYHAVIDCDVKSQEPKHLAEMEKRLRDLINAETWTVVSGRGNGSRHLHIATAKPVSSRKWAKSSDEVKVKMPSVDPSRKELTKLSADEIRAGWRLRPAWEIEIMGVGRQVVLPPSIHPDSGKPYKAGAKAPIAMVELPEAASGDLDPVKSETVPTGASFRKIDLALETSLSASTISLIVDGEGCDDRSAAIFKVAAEMVRKGLTHDDVASILTEPTYFLGKAAYEHAQTKDRRKAAKWVLKYTYKKAKATNSLEAIFGGDDDDAPELSDEAAKKQEEEILASHKPRDWRDRIKRTSQTEGAPPQNTLENVLLILDEHGPKPIFKRDLFSGTDLYARPTVWGGKTGAELKDADIVNIKVWFVKKWRIEPSDKTIMDAIQFLSHQAAYHPVRQYLKSLVWDRVPRVSTWLKDYMGAEAPEPYLSAVSRKSLLAMVSRVMEPGCKFDHVLIFEGLQGKGKSSAIKILADPWFSDAAVDPSDKDSVVNLRAVWCMEIPELSTMRHSDIEVWKAYVTRQVDRVRMPYGRLAENFPRQCIFIGTTNNQEYLKDASGNRRFWPVLVRQCLFDELRRDRDQLLAEAFFMWQFEPEPLYLNDAENAIAIEEQEARMSQDPWVDLIADFIKQDKVKDTPFLGGEFALISLFDSDGPLGSERAHRANLMRASDALRALKYDKIRKRTKNENPKWLWKLGGKFGVVPS